MPSINCHLYIKPTTLSFYKVVVNASGLTSNLEVLRSNMTEDQNLGLHVCTGTTYFQSVTIDFYIDNNTKFYTCQYSSSDSSWSSSYLGDSVAGYVFCYTATSDYYTAYSQVSGESNNSELSQIGGLKTSLNSLGGKKLGTKKYSLNTDVVTTFGTLHFDKSTGIVSGFDSNTTNYMTIPFSVNDTLYLAVKVTDTQTKQCLGGEDMSLGIYNGYFGYNSLSGNGEFTNFFPIQENQYIYLKLTGISTNNSLGVRCNLDGSSEYTLLYNSLNYFFGYSGITSMRLGYGFIEGSYYGFNSELDLSKSYIITAAGDRKYLTSVEYIPLDRWTQPTLSANGSIGGNSFAVYSSNSEVWKAFDGNMSTSYNSGTLHDFTLYNPEPIKITNLGISLSSAYGIEGGDITYFIQGSNSGSEWENITYTNNENWTSVDLNNTNYYKYYKFYIPSYRTSTVEYTITARVDLNSTVLLSIGIYDTNGTQITSTDTITLDGVTYKILEREDDYMPSGTTTFLHVLNFYVRPYSTHNCTVTFSGQTITKSGEITVTNSETHYSFSSSGGYASSGTSMG